jgi:hypothetical protein
MFIWLGVEKVGRQLANTAPVVSLENAHGVDERMKVDDNIQGVHNTLEGVPGSTREVDSEECAVNEIETGNIGGA